MDYPLISILIPVFQREHLIAECISSALQSNYPNLEVVVCDNASTDRTKEICSQFSEKDARVRFYENERNLGPVENWRICAKKANGAYVKMLFSDDRVRAGFLEKAVVALQDKRIGLVYSSARVFGDTESILYSKCPGSTRLIPARNFIDEFFMSFGNSPVSPGCTMLRTEDFLRYLKTEFKYSKFDDFSTHGSGPDVALLHGIAAAHESVVHIDAPLNEFRAHAGSITIADHDAKSNKIWLRLASAALSHAREVYGDSYFYRVASRFYLHAWRENKCNIKTFVEDYGLHCDAGRISLFMGLSVWFAHFLRRKIRGRAWESSGVGFKV